MVPITRWQKFRSILGFVFLPAVCLLLFLLLSYQVERIIEDSEPAAAAARLKGDPHVGDPHSLVAHEGTTGEAPVHAQPPQEALPLD